MVGRKIKSLPELFKLKRGADREMTINKEHLFLHRTRVWFQAPTCLTTTWNYSSRRSSVLFWHRLTVYTHIVHTHMQVKTVKYNKKELKTTKNKISTKRSESAGVGTDMALTYSSTHYSSVIWCLSFNISDSI